MNNMCDDRTGRTRVVTGFTSGIGEAVASGLTDRGARVLGVARSAEKAEAALARIRERNPGGRVEPLIADLSALTEVVDVAERIKPTQNGSMC